MSNLGKGETHAMHRRMAAKRERDKASRAKRVGVGSYEGGVRSEEGRRGGWREGAMVGLID